MFQDPFNMLKCALKLSRSLLYIVIGGRYCCVKSMNYVEVLRITAKYMLLLSKTLATLTYQCFNVLFTCYRWPAYT